MCVLYGHAISIIPLHGHLYIKNKKKRTQFSGVRFINTFSTDKRYSRQSQKVEDSMVLKYDIKHQYSINGR